MERKDRNYRNVHKRHKANQNKMRKNGGEAIFTETGAESFPSLMDYIKPQTG